ncbi:phage protease [Glaesserella parasuis]|nr:phage protease [Glaesserella parasuis]MCT8570922.1 phage protease [Glaesserella parasuis]MCT8628217.1 phage protease [Glaesserella parasuis]MCT8685156.1 phage protease [Glaesserella parasuis]MCT8796940.1 phage protease [Glaesserella parasuis]
MRCVVERKFKLNPIACSFELAKEVNGRIQLFPFGWFHPQDGREGAFYVGDSNGYQLADEINQLGIELMIDYEHQTLFIAENGKGNPAAGWIVRAEYISGEGLFADVRWTSKAVAEIKDGVYRYISPLFLADASGTVIKVLNAALTNRPALHNLAEAVAMSAQFSHFLEPNEDKTKMKELLIKLFGLSAQATDDEITTKLTALSAAKGDSSVALSDVYAELAKEQGQVVALTAKVNNPDPAKFVALSDLQAVQTELNQIKQQMNDKERDALIQTALSDGRLLPAQKAWAEKLGKENLVALSDYLATVSPNPALAGTQSGGKDPNEQAQQVALSAAEMAGAKALGLTPEEYIEKYKKAGA